MTWVQGYFSIGIGSAVMTAVACRLAPPRTKPISLSAYIISVPMLVLLWPFTLLLSFYFMMAGFSVRYRIARAKRELRSIERFERDRERKLREWRANRLKEDLAIINGIDGH